MERKLKPIRLKVIQVFGNHCLVERNDGKYEKYYFVAHNPKFLGYGSIELKEYSHSTGYGWCSFDDAVKMFIQDYIIQDD